MDHLEFDRYATRILGTGEDLATIWSLTADEAPIPLGGGPFLPKVEWAGHWRQQPWPVTSTGYAKVASRSPMKS